jgi:hypothetical protein
MVQKEKQKRQFPGYMGNFGYKKYGSEPFAVAHVYNSSCSGSRDPEDHSLSTCQEKKKDTISIHKSWVWSGVPIIPAT